MPKRVDDSDWLIVVDASGVEPRRTGRGALSDTDQWAAVQTSDFEETPATDPGTIDRYRDVHAALIAEAILAAPGCLRILVVDRRDGTMLVDERAAVPSEAEDVADDATGSALVDLVRAMESAFGVTPAYTASSTPGRHLIVARTDRASNCVVCGVFDSGCSTLAASIRAVEAETSLSRQTLTLDRVDR